MYSFKNVESLKSFLDAKVAQYNQVEFIEKDPISIPHLFSQKQDIEIAGLFAAVLAWGQRKTIINKCKDLLQRMDFAPYDFVKNHQENDLKKLLAFKHRTFNDTDLLYFIYFLKYHYSKYDSLEMAFIPQKENFQLNYLEHENSLASQNEVCMLAETYFSTEQSLNYFRNYFMSLPDFPNRTKKHISSPAQKSTCKRLNMFLRWMVRKDEYGVDFGIWSYLKPSQLICPCDVHVDRVARQLNLIDRSQTDWRTAIELTGKLKELDNLDPVKYDFALFGIGIEEKLAKI